MPKTGENEELERAIVGALRSAIKDHGPITPERIGSAAKRIMGQLANAKITGLARVMGRRRWAGVSDEDKSEHQAAAARGRWATMTPEERSEEMSRRRRAGLKKKTP